ncbi:uncharacterized protein [Drosophila tropicalis]|uniref:uncharacterized protein n=1 Tax=Drosophila tropicalis TaxID=46794 RepID=UPI0035AB8BF7
MTAAACKLTIPVIMIVCNVFAPSAHGQSYLLTLENVLTRQLPYNTTGNNNTSLETEVFADPTDNNTRIFVYKNTVVESSPNELSQTAMDVITIVWYVATFLALAAFFMLMACSDRRCRDVRSHPSATTNEGMRAPPTPSPSYSEFAPPSYDTVIKMQHAAKTSVFVIPFNGEHKPSEGIIATPTITAPVCNVFTVNEVQKAAH